MKTFAEEMRAIAFKKAQENESAEHERQTKELDKIKALIQEQAEIGKFALYYPITTFQEEVVKSWGCTTIFSLSKESTYISWR
ncbi:MAG: hypothetical protein RLZ10_2166 [Bacteroidota bacterium]|jgi:hypothetical protein